MPSTALTLSRLASGGLITNYFCTSACRHCLYRCSSGWPKDTITAETARRNLEAVRRLGIMCMVDSKRRHGNGQIYSD
jgi:hypothetical protein